MYTLQICTCIYKIYMYALNIYIYIYVWTAIQACYISNATNYKFFSSVNIMRVHQNQVECVFLF